MERSSFTRTTVVNLLFRALVLFLFVSRPLPVSCTLKFFIPRCQVPTEGSFRVSDVSEYLCFFGQINK